MSNNAYRSFVAWRTPGEFWNWGEWNADKTSFVEAEKGYRSLHTIEVVLGPHLADDSDLIVSDYSPSSEMAQEYSLLADRILDPPMYEAERSRIAAQNYATAREVLDRAEDAYLVRYCLDLDDIRAESEIEIIGAVYSDEDGDLVIDLEDGSRLPLFNGDELNAYVRGVFLAPNDDLD